ncbi:MAG: ATP-binding cassette domain-containing protein [Gammaproteobacteria bacterium]|nr:ATP-binding cassette domain-containing protein [Gammaproteobacteria bacterium]
MDEPLEMKLGNLLQSHGTLFTGGANKPIRLNDPDKVWFVESGALDVFISENQDNTTTSSLKHMLRAGPGRLVFGIQESTLHALTAVGKGLPESVLRLLSLNTLLENSNADDLASQVDLWIMDLTAAVVRDIPRLHFPNVAISPKDSLELKAGDIVCSRQNVVWSNHSSQMSSFLDTEETDRIHSDWLVLTPESWLTALSPGSTECVDSRSLLDDGQLFSSLGEYHQLLLRAERTNQDLAQADRANQEIERKNHSRFDKEKALEDLYSTFLQKPAAGDTAQDSGLLSALAKIGDHEGIAFRTPTGRYGQENTESFLNKILLVSGVKRRAVHLDVEERWWRGNSGAMLAFRKVDGGCVALVPGWGSRYRMIDPETGRSELCNKDTTKSLHQKAWLFYCPLPNDGSLGAWEIFRFSTSGMKGGFLRFTLAGLLASLLTLAPAIAIEYIVNELIPPGFVYALLLTILILITASVTGALLQMLQGTALIHVEGQAATRSTSAIWSRLLTMSPSFFKRHSAGELMVRAMAFQSLRDHISGVVANSVLSLVFLLPAFLLISIFDPLLGWISFMIGVVVIAIAILLIFLQTNPQRQLFTASRKLTSSLLTFINGMHKLRLNHAEDHAIASWARDYRKQKVAELNTGRLSNYFIALSTAVPVLASGVIFSVVIYRGPDNFSLGDFLAIFAILMIFCLAVMRFGQSLESIASIVPSFEQVQPILQEKPEIHESTDSSHELHGRIDFDRVSFRYSEDSPLVLDGVSIHAGPGEFIAIAGESGAGKTTLLQLALGMVKPLAGAVYYDTRDLAHLNCRFVRQQIGLVLQDGVLMPGNILENINGTLSELTTEDAWRAAKLAAVDREIAAMPMGMFTIMGDNESIFSGGQAQRIRIAAALAKKPRIVIFDEATNWLDTENQAMVIESLENLVATRIVIAHRLSTIRKADRIYVLKSGKIVQEGKFEELFNTEGYFRQLMLRQVI